MALTASDPFHLVRFVEAQRTTYEQVRAELMAGRKRTHWMWFIFPQIRGLGSSPMAERYAISGQSEAGAYLRDPLLGGRLRECTALVNSHPKITVSAIFGYPDHLKFHSCVTLFAEVAATSGLDGDAFRDALNLHFDGRPDEATLRLLKTAP